METTPQSTTLAMLSHRYDIPLSRIRATLKTIGVFVGRDAATLVLSDEHVAHVLASFPEETARPLAEIPTSVLLEQYGSILAELRARDVVRTANAPVGDYAEYLAQQVYGGTLAQSSAKSYDLITDDLQTIQVKARAVGSTSSRATTFSAFRSFDFDIACFLLFDARTYRLIWAKELTASEARSASRRSEHVNANHLTRSIVERRGADVTAKFASILAQN